MRFGLHTTTMTYPSNTEPPDIRPDDAQPASWVDRAPNALRPYLRLSRFDRPIGFWLLALPCLTGMALAVADLNGRIGDISSIDLGILGFLALAFVVGAIAMRGAGCTYNDILDRDIDARVARTAGRPLASGQLGMRRAWTWLFVQCGVGLVVLLLLPGKAQVIALAAIPLVAAYPLMKRITWWPQAWLGITFNWGVLVGFAAVADALSLPAFLAFAGLALWTLGYDTIYALQDREDDALVGVRSTARRFGRQVKVGIALAYGLSAVLLGYAFVVAGGGWAWLCILPFMIDLAVQIWKLVPDDPANALALFRANREAGLLMLAGACALAAFSTL